MAKKEQDRVKQAEKKARNGKRLDLLTKPSGARQKGKSEGPAPYKAKKKWSDGRAAFSQVPHWLVTSAGLNAMNADKMTHQTHGQHSTAYRWNG